MPVRRIHLAHSQAATSGTARDINRGILLNLIRRRQPISRADLARVSGLQRSTVSLITEQLIHERWVVYGPVGRIPRGRRPTFLQLNDRRAILALDLRPGTSIIAVSDVNGRFLSHQRLSTPTDPKTAPAKFGERIRRVMDSHPELVFEGIGISLPGRFDEEGQRVVFAPNLKWPDFDLRGPVEKATGLHVEMENAANACLLAEVWFGPAENHRDMVLVTVSEGLGVGIFSDAHLVRGQRGMAGEFGHVPLDPDGPPCNCGARGCWEVYASSHAALRYYHESAAESEWPNFQHLLNLAQGGDKLALRAMDQMAHGIARGMRMLLAGLAPEEIIFVGDFTQLWARIGPVIEAEVSRSALIAKPPRVRPSVSEPSVARLRGAIALVLYKHFGAYAASEPARKKAEAAPRDAALAG